MTFLPYEDWTPDADKPKLQPPSELDYAFYKAVDALREFGKSLAELAATMRADRRQCRIYRRARKAWLRRQYA